MSETHIKIEEGVGTSCEWHVHKLRQSCVNWSVWTIVYNTVQLSYEKLQFEQYTSLVIANSMLNSAFLMVVI